MLLTLNLRYTRLSQVIAHCRMKQERARLVHHAPTTTAACRISPTCIRNHHATSHTGPLEWYKAPYKVSHACVIDKVSAAILAP